MCVLSRFRNVRLFPNPWTVACQLLHPWDSLGKNTEVGCHLLLQIFPTQGLSSQFNQFKRLRSQAKWVPYVKDLVACCAKLLQSCPAICDPMDCIPPGCSFHGTLQARTLGGLLFPPPGHLPNPGIKPTFPTRAGMFYTIRVI